MDDRTAYKMFILDLIERPFSQEEGGPGTLDYAGISISTVRIMGTVVSRYEAENYLIYTLDDSTETVSVRIFGEDMERFSSYDVGDIVDVVGSLREYEGEKYIVPRTVQVVEDPNWEVARRLELLIRGKKMGVESSSAYMQIEDVVSDFSGLIMDLVEKLDDGSGADYKELLKGSGLAEKQLDDGLNELLSKGDIYEPKIGRFKKV